MVQILLGGKGKKGVAEACLGATECSTTLTCSVYTSLFSKPGFQNQNLLSLIASCSPKRLDQFAESPESHHILASIILSSVEPSPLMPCCQGKAWNWQICCSPMMLYTWDLREQDWGDLGSALKFTVVFLQRTPSCVQETCNPRSKRGGGRLTRQWVKEKQERPERISSRNCYRLRTEVALMCREAKCLERRGGARWI